MAFTEAPSFTRSYIEEKAPGQTVDMFAIKLTHPVQGFGGPLDLGTLAGEAGLYPWREDGINALLLFDGTIEPGKTPDALRRYEIPTWLVQASRDTGIPLVLGIGRTAPKDRSDSLDGANVSLLGSPQRNPTDDLSAVVSSGRTGLATRTTVSFLHALLVFRRTLGADTWTVIHMRNQNHTRVQSPAGKAQPLSRFEKSLLHPGDRIFLADEPNPLVFQIENQTDGAVPVSLYVFEEIKT